MRATWTGTISYGLINVPVKLFGAADDHTSKMHKLHGECGSRVSQKWVCKGDCTDEVAFGDLGSGYEASKDELVELTDTDLASLPQAPKREATIVDFVDAGELEPWLLGKPYYVAPQLPSKTSNANGSKPYALIREALRLSDKVAIVRVVLRTRESLAVLRVHDNMLVMQSLVWADEVRVPELDIPEVELTEAEAEQAAQLVSSATVKWDHTRYVNRYQEALVELVEAKRKPVVVEPVGAQVIDINDILAARVAQLSAI